MIREPLLTRDPEIKAVTLAVLVGIADAIERESLRRYESLAATMQRRGEAATAAAFRAMHGEEQQHAAEVARWAAGLGQAAPQPGKFEWQLPADLSSSWDEIAGSALLTPYRAFAIAVDNEKRAFELYSYLAARATDPRVRAEAERLAVAELQHAAVMRRWRRQAWHREQRGAAQAAAAPVIRTPQALHAWLGEREAAAARTHRALALRLRALGDEASARLLESLPAVSAAAGSTGADAPIPDTDDPAHLLVAAQKPLEALSEALDAVMRTTEGDLFGQAQAAHADVVRRLARIALQTARVIEGG